MNRSRHNCCLAPQITPNLTWCITDFSYFLMYEGEGQMLSCQINIETDNFQLDPMHSGLNGSTCFAASNLPFRKLHGFLKCHGNKETMQYFDVNCKFCRLFMMFVWKMTCLSFTVEVSAFDVSKLSKAVLNVPTLSIFLAWNLLSTNWESGRGVKW